LTDTTTTTVPYSTNGQTRIWGYTYYSNGLLNTVDGPLAGSGDTATYAYNARGFVNSITDVLGHVTTISSTNGRGQPLTSVDPNGVTTNYTYDDRGRILSITVNPGASQAVTASPTISLEISRSSPVRTAQPSLMPTITRTASRR